MIQLQNYRPWAASLSWLFLGRSSELPLLLSLLLLLLLKSAQKNRIHSLGYYYFLLGTHFSP